MTQLRRQQQQQRRRQRRRRQQPRQQWWQRRWQQWRQRRRPSDRRWKTEKKVYDRFIWTETNVCTRVKCTSGWKGYSRSNNNKNNNDNSSGSKEGSIVWNKAVPILSCQVYGVSKLTPATKAPGLAVTSLPVLFNRLYIYHFSPVFKLTQSTNWFANIDKMH